VDLNVPITFQLVKSLRYFYANLDDAKRQRRDWHLSDTLVGLQNVY
jgi:hypothetical protein